jgi:hypothetical protein
LYCTSWQVSQVLVDELQPTLPGPIPPAPTLELEVAVVELALALELLAPDPALAVALAPPAPEAAVVELTDVADGAVAGLVGCAVGAGALTALQAAAEEASTAKTILLRMVILLGRGSLVVRSFSTIHAGSKSSIRGENRSPGLHATCIAPRGARRVQLAAAQPSQRDVPCDHLP